MGIHPGETGRIFSEKVTAFKAKVNAIPEPQPPTLELSESPTMFIDRTDYVSAAGGKNTVLRRPAGTLYSEPSTRANGIAAAAEGLLPQRGVIYVQWEVLDGLPSPDAATQKEIPSAHEAYVPNTQAS